jgi:signal transduction histidine kinase
LVIGFSILGIASFYNTQHEAEEIYDAQMSHFARMLELLTVRGVTLVPPAPVDKFNIQYNTPQSSYEKNFAYRVWINGKPVLKSLNSTDFGDYPKEEGFSDRKLDGKDWRFLTIKDGPLTVEVAEDYEARQDLIDRVILSIFIPLIILIPLILFTVIYGLKVGLKPLSSLSNAVSRRNVEDLHPINKEDIPEEVEPLVDNLNNLMEKIEDALEKEKRFTSYAAHELRTPLAALKAQIQVALRHKDLNKQKEMFGDVTIGIDRMSHLVEQLLTLMRVQKGSIERHSFNISELLDKIVKSHKSQAKERDLNINSNISHDLNIEANSEMIEIMFNNLISNSIKYSDGKEDIKINLTEEDKGISFSISNPSKNISKEELQNMFEPFHRLKGETETGAGIGLSIVKWIVDAHGGEINARYKAGKLEHKLYIY